MLPAKKVPYEGPDTFYSIINRIVDDAKKEGRDHLTYSVVSDSIMSLFGMKIGFKFIRKGSVRIPGIGTFVVDPAIVKYINEYEKKLDRYRKKIIYSTHYIGQVRKNNKKAYQDYCNETKFPFSFDRWMSETGRAKRMKRLKIRRARLTYWANKHREKKNLFFSDHISNT